MILLSKDLWEIKGTTKKGRGIFAKKNIIGGVMIGDYLGKVLKTSEIDFSKKQSEIYLMYYHDQSSILPNLKEPGAHLLNHSCMPNCWMYIYFGHTLFFTLRHIFKGEELTISYLLSPKGESCKLCPHLCMCGSSICSGTMHLTEERYKKWRAFQSEVEKKDKRAKIRYNQDLPKLSSYPKTIPDNSIYDMFGNEKEKTHKINAKKLPSIQKLRREIRKRGKVIELPVLKKTVIGIQNGEIIFKNSLRSP